MQELFFFPKGFEIRDPYKFFSYFYYFVVQNNFKDSLGLSKIFTKKGNIVLTALHH